MNFTKLNKEDFNSGDVVRGEPGIRFEKSGLVSLNKSAVKHLCLYDAKTKKYHGVSFMCDAVRKFDVYIYRDDDGWEIRPANKKEEPSVAVFNNVALSQHIIDLTWEANVSRPVGAVKPRSYCFRVALLPVDDDKNKNVFALIRKKE